MFSAAENLTRVSNVHAKDVEVHVEDEEVCAEGGQTLALRHERCVAGMHWSIYGPSARRPHEKRIRDKVPLRFEVDQEGEATLLVMRMLVTVLSTPKFAAMSYSLLQDA
nr:hypothetical protein Iba_chr14aCG5510 [Ipomoea batatas]GMD89669.1 hypothetical protein Iba_chr14dCG2260 [Ipomoea batatas]